MGVQRRHKIPEPARADDRRPRSPMVSEIGRQAMTLLVEARNYFFASQVAGQPPVVSYYRMVVTNRLIWIMAWVLYQKAVENGEIPPAAALEAMADIQNNQGEPEWRENISSDLPPALLSLVYRSGALRERVVRLVAGGRSGLPDHAACGPEVVRLRAE